MSNYEDYSFFGKNKAFSVTIWRTDILPIVLVLPVSAYRSGSSLVSLLYQKPIVKLVLTALRKTIVLDHILYKTKIVPKKLHLNLDEIDFNAEYSLHNSGGHQTTLFISLGFARSRFPLGKLYI